MLCWCGCRCIHVSIGLWCAGVAVGVFMYLLACWCAGVAVGVFMYLLACAVLVCVCRCIHVSIGLLVWL